MKSTRKPEVIKKSAQTGNQSIINVSAKDTKGNRETESFEGRMRQQGGVRQSTHYAAARDFWGRKEKEDQHRKTEE